MCILLYRTCGQSAQSIGLETVGPEFYWYRSQTCRIGMWYSFVPCSLQNRSEPGGESWLDRCSGGGFRSTGVHSRAVLTPLVPPTNVFPPWLAPQIKDLPRTIHASDEPYHISPIKEGKIRREVHKGETKLISDRDIIHLLHWHKRCEGHTKYPT